jgi:hypothetical protein
MKGFLLALFLTSLIYLSSFAGKVYAQIPSPTPIPCGRTENPEFHSLRPYQASPCQSTMSTSAKFCGNNLILHDSVTESYPGGGDCKKTGEKITCTYNEPITLPVTIDLSGASLPFMGNTEDVPNSQPPTGLPLDDAEKMNGYVSWYLNGVINRAESGSEANTDSNIINFSGPINKLLPGVILDFQRIKTIQNVDANKNHNQIAVCADKKYWLFGPVTPKECYQGNSTPATGEHRLEEWSKNDLGIARSLTTVLGRFLKIIPGISQTQIAEAVASTWDKRIPPLPWADKNGKPFANELLYQKAYNEWKGRSCVVFLGRLFCLDWDPTNVLVNSEWSELYSYIPLSSTEDLKGSISIDSVSSATGLATGVKVSGVSFSEQKPAELFFSHMEGVSQLGSALQDTFVGQGQDQVGSPTDVQPNVACIPTEVRSNKGDNLFAKQITGTLKYNAGFSCEFNPVKPATNPNCFNNCLAQKRPASECGSVCSAPGVTAPVTQTCTKDVYITLTTKSSSPKADEIWSRLVAGPTSVFRRLAPKIGSDGPIECIMDIPGSTSISYQGTGVNTDAELNLPHLGGISAYFLEGIQTMLRPQGYGEQVITGQNCKNICSSGKNGTLPDLPDAKEASCKLSGSGTLLALDFSKLPTLVRIVEAAADAYKTPPKLILGIMYGEGVFNPGRYQWTEENVKKWSAGCATMPNCTPGVWPSQVTHYYEPYWESVKDAVKVVDPGREPNPCNLMDNIFSIARDLHGNSGTSSFAGKTCFGIPLKTGASNPNSCSWGPSDIETAIKVWETGGTDMCVTKEGGCAIGGLNAICPTGDTCETINKRYSSPSHNACVWDVAHGK